MADAELNPQQSGKLQRFTLPLIVILCVTAVLGLFLIGYLTLTTPVSPPEDINTITEKLKAGTDEEEIIDDDEKS